MPEFTQDVHRRRLTFLCVVVFRAYTEPLSNAGGSMEPPSVPPPPPPAPPPLNVPPSRARLQLAARLAMHQKNTQATESSSATLHHADEDEDDGDNPTDPFADTEEDLDDDDEGQDGGQGSWWRGVVRTKGKTTTTTTTTTDGNESDDERDDDDDDEFGDFAMAEDDHKLVLRPLAVNPAKEGNTRGLSGLWPFGLSKTEKEGEGQSNDGGSGGVGDEAGDGDDKKAVEVKEAKRRTSIEDPDDDEVVI
ncbi:sporulation-induced protein [Neonectria punicea]|uniref:Sporulation-induced protein n=1 Tax=Neonectria punicea TaxID=979145 RepID=A0ABR1HJV8_9HYPO